MPSAARPFNDWNRSTAFFVFVPKIPSSASSPKPARLSANCKSSTDGPVLPYFKILIFRSFILHKNCLPHFRIEKRTAGN